MKLFSTYLVIVFMIPVFCKAQDNYEIQVYGSEAVPKGNTMVELHSNFTFDGSKEVSDGVLSTNHVFHETVEITHGWTPWLETGSYFFNTIGNDQRTSYVGSHIRPRVMAPKRGAGPWGQAYHWKPFPFDGLFNVKSGISNTNKRKPEINVK